MKSTALLLLAVLSGAVSLPAQEIIQTPDARQGIRQFEFAGGTPAEFIARVKEVFGTLSERGSAVTMTDETGGDPLPPFKAFAGSAENLIGMVAGRTNRIKLEQNEQGWLNLRFTGRNPAPAAAPETEEVPVFTFPGGTPAELIAAVDLRFGKKLSDVMTVDPSLERVRFPAFKIRTDSYSEVISFVNMLSSAAASGCGIWEYTADGNSFRYIALVPSYSEQNPSPALTASLQSAGGGAAEIRRLRAEVKKLKAELNAARNQSR